MKKLNLFCCACVGLLSVVTAGVSQAQNPQDIQSAAAEVALPPVILDKGPHQQTIQTTTLLTDVDGVVVTNVSSVIALGTGMNYFDPAQNDWAASDPTFDLTPNGVTAQRMQHQVTLLANPNQKGAVTLIMPDGQVMVSHVLGLSYYDAASGQSVLIAAVQDAQGQLLPSRREVIFPNAFDTVNADLRYISQ